MSELLRVGLTGGIASGKTLASDQLGALGATIIDTDVIAREVVAVGSEGLRKIQNTFGDDILNDDGTLDRAALRELVFSEPLKRQQLEAITHPLIGERCWAEYQSAQGAYAVFVVPLLTQSALRPRMHRVAVVDCSAATQIQRLCQRDNDTPLSARRILDAQASRKTRLAIADDVLHNDSSRDRFIKAIHRLHQFYCRIT